MMKLTDTQRVILSTASQRTDRLAMPLPKSIKGGAALKVINPLIERGLLEEVDANRKLGDPVWRDTGDGHGVTLIVTDKGLEAIGVEPDRPHGAAQKATQPEKAEKAPTAAAEAKTVPAAAAATREAKPHREGTKQSAMIDMLRQPEGATLDEIAAATGWQKHTIRGAMAGTLKKKLGLTIASDKVDGRGRVYKIAA
jgi:hypothetical protein